MESRESSLTALLLQEEEKEQLFLSQGVWLCWKLPGCVPRELAQAQV